MLVNLTEYFDVQGKAHLSIPYESEKFFDGFEDREILDRTPIELDIVPVGEGKLEISGHLSVTLKDKCSRCLDDVNVTVPASFSYTVVKPDGYHELSEEEQLFMEGYSLDADALVYNELLMSLPMKVLCRDDCKGLCPKCFINRNHGECGCDTFVPDPRMAAIMDIFNANKEV
ncbi:MAG: DUF177 domain-containing protein [Lachnospiraceae bacterium]|nr:DUF177 domain-containing protein [Lachnospiraceae bacterium]